MFDRNSENILHVNDHKLELKNSVLITWTGMSHFDVYDYEAVEQLSSVYQIEMDKQ